MSGLIILGMVINMDESQLRTIEQIGQFLTASAEVAFTAHGGDVERYAHISRVLKRFDYADQARKVVRPFISHCALRKILTLNCMRLPSTLKLLETEIQADAYRQSR